jgi:hypothetical protein
MTVPPKLFFWRILYYAYILEEKCCCGKNQDGYDE